MQSGTDIRFFIRLHRLYRLMTESFPAMPNGHAVVTADVNKRNLLHLVSLDVSCVLQQKNVCEFKS